VRGQELLLLFMLVLILIATVLRTRTENKVLRVTRYVLHEFSAGGSKIIIINYMYVCDVKVSLRAPRPIEIEILLVLVRTSSNDSAFLAFIRKNTETERTQKNFYMRRLF
jgi:hypothetical protein